MDREVAEGMERYARQILFPGIGEAGQKKLSQAPADFGAALDQSFEIACRTGLHCAPDAARTIGAFPLGTIRLSLSDLNTAEQIDATLDAVGRLAASSLL